MKASCLPNACAKACASAKLRRHADSVGQRNLGAHFLMNKKCKFEMLNYKRSLIIKSLAPSPNGEGPRERPMNFKNFEWRILIRVLFLFITLSFTSFLVVKQWYVYLLLAAPVIIYQLIDIFRFQKKAQDELNEFVESVHYRDFSRYFDVKHAPIELQPLRKGFNEINTTFKVISKEKETQYQYLQKILELVDTGILSYEEQTGDVVWMNESLKK